MDNKKLKSWQGWCILVVAMAVVFVLGILVSTLAERRSEVASIFNNRKTVFEGQESRNDRYRSDFQREYDT